MFRLALAGKSTVQITKILTERKIVISSFYKAQNGGTRFDRYSDGKGESARFEWCNATVQTILKNQTYAGNIVNHKYEVANYKTKECVPVPKSEHIIVKNTHEAIVEYEDFFTVQELIKQWHRPKRHDYENVFKSLVFCSECGSRLTFEVKSRKHVKRPMLVCRHHFTNPDKCKNYNFIYYEDLNATVLQKIKEILESMESGDLAKKVLKQTQDKQKTSRLQAEKAKLQHFDLKIRQVGISRMPKPALSIISANKTKGV